jgi:hypothetical protein
VSRGVTAFEIFQRGVSPVEAELGESYDSGRRTGESAVLVSVQLSVRLGVQSPLGQIACPDI